MDIRRRWAISATLVMVLVSGQPAAAGTTGGAAAGARPLTDVIGPVTAVAAGWGHNLGLRPDGTVIAWGWNDAGQLGNGDCGWYQSETPVPVCAVGQTAPCTRFLTGVIAIVAGEYHSLALLRDRTVVAWGYNIAGQLGDGSTVDRLTPVRVSRSTRPPPATRSCTR
ncbi:RCC1 domain-containing protein [Solwaraspora sp. WMMA2101]|uniref:RCC1 domain-containing protein n=1 Tax=Solwaraspora sp. WMMA2101 TaxID=3404124 RepID=UPI003B926CEE